MSAIMMGWLGQVPLAAHGIALNLASATFMVHLGLSNAATIRAGNALGRKGSLRILEKGAIAVTGMSSGGVRADGHSVSDVRRAADFPVHGGRMIHNARRFWRLALGCWPWLRCSSWSTGHK